MDTIARIVRAPFTLVSLIIGGTLMFLYLAAISVGGWYEKILLNLRLRIPDWLPAVLGILTFASIGVVLPAVALYSLVGWPGLLLGPTITVLMIARLDHW